MSLTMIKLEPDMGRLIRWAERQRLLSPRGADDLGYALHALLAAAFDDKVPKPFTLRHEASRPAVLLAYSAFQGDDLLQQAQATAEPDVAAAIGLDTFAAKIMPDLWPEGQRFGFTVKVCPTLRVDRDGNRNRTKEVDAFLLSPPQSDRGVVYGNWLRDRLSGAHVEQVNLESFRRSYSLRRDAGRALQRREGPEAELSGILRVGDGASFKASLARGIGRHRAFGFGMLLLRPAR